MVISGPESAQGPVENCIKWRQQVLPDMAWALLECNGMFGIKLSPSGRSLARFQPRHSKDDNAACLQHWHLVSDAISAHLLKQADLFDQPLVQTTPQLDIHSLAWHSQQVASLYAVWDGTGGVHIIDAHFARCSHG